MLLRRRLTSLLSTSIVSPRPTLTLTPSPSSQSSLHFLPHSSNPNPSFSANGKASALGFVQGVRAYSSLLSLNDLRPRVPRKQKTRKGRGIGSGKGKTAGRGHKGQKARGSGKLGFEGGQTPLRRRLPKRGFKNPFSLTFQPVGLGKIAKLINAGKIDSSELITMKTLKDTGAIGKQIKDGMRLMGRGAEHIKWPINLEVSRVTVRAKAAVEAAGGSVRRVYYNKLGFRALLTPEWFEKRADYCQEQLDLRQNRRIRLIALAACQPQPNLFHFLLKKMRQPPVHLLDKRSKFSLFTQDIVLFIPVSSSMFGINCLFVRSVFCCKM